MRIVMFVLCVILVGCVDPVGPEHSLAGVYVHVGMVQDGSFTPADPGGPAAVTVLGKDRRWNWFMAAEGVARLHQVSDRYTLDGRDDRGRRLDMFEGLVLAVYPGTAWIRGDTLEWGSWLYVRR